MLLFRYGPIAARESRPYSWAKAADPDKARARNIPGTKRRDCATIIGSSEKCRHRQIQRETYTGCALFSSAKRRNSNRGLFGPLRFDLDLD